MYIGLKEILNSQLRYNFSWTERQQQEVYVMQHFLVTAHSFYVGTFCY